MPEKIKARKRSFQFQIMIIFCLISIIPLIIIGGWAYQSAKNTALENMQEKAELNMKQTSMSIAQQFQNYEELVTRICIDEDAIEIIDHLNEGKDMDMNKVLMQEMLRDYAGEDSTIHAVTFVAKNQETAFYDIIASGVSEEEWLQSAGMTADRISNECVSEENWTIYPSAYVTTFGNRSYYLFHIGKTVVDYRDINKANGVILISINQDVLLEFYNRNIPEELKKETEAFILDKDGRILCCSRKELCGEKVVLPDSSETEQKKQCLNFIRENNLAEGRNLSIYTYTEPDTGWTYVYGINQEMLVSQAKEQWGRTILVVALISIVLCYVIVRVSKRMTRSITEIADIMKEAEDGKYVQIPHNPNRTTEIDIIANQYNCMIEKIEDSLQKEKEAVIRQKDAEIVALETQINPHFLYNTLDTINWVAIDKEEYQISEMINSLAVILRYGINKSNRIVTVADEMEWMKKYVFLQQEKVKHNFSCKMDIEEKVLGYRIYKLLLQPFIENAIVHGFEEINPLHELQIRITKEENRLCIVIEDNGKGMEEETVEKLLHGEEMTGKNHIGIRNSLNRIHLYYGESAEVKIESRIGEGTRITIWLPVITEEMEAAE